MSIRKLKQLREALRALQIDEKGGTMTAYGERFLFIPVKLIHSIEDRLATQFGPATSTLFLYEIGKEGGEQYARVAEKAGLDLKKGANIQEVTKRLGTMSGWGKIEITEFDPEHSIARIRWWNGVSVRNRKGKTPVCHFGRGILTGALEVIFDRDCESLEISCQGKGDEYCEAIIAKPEEIGRVADSHRHSHSF